MYVVKRAFRNYGHVMVPGSVVEPETTKRFKSRLKDGHIINVHEQDIDKYKEYFRVRHGVELVVPTPAEESADQTEGSAKQTEAPTEPTQPTVTVAKAAVVVKPH